MPLSLLLYLGSLAGAAAWARISTTFAGEGEQSLTDHLTAILEVTPAAGDVQILASCCGQYQGQALEVTAAINTNSMSGSTEGVAKSIFRESGCTAVPKDQRRQKTNRNCTYLAVFENLLHADYEYAANCVPAQICKDDAVGMSKGIIAMYGVVLQTLQQNLGDLVHLAQGPIAKCYQARETINLGHPGELLHEKEIKLGSVVIGSETSMEVPGMKKLSALQSLGPCADDASIGYLYVHRNLYWSGEKSALDLAAFSVLERQKEGQEAQDSVQQALGKGASAAARADNKTAEEMLQKVGAVAPKALEEDLDKEAVRAAEASGEVDAEEEKSLKRLVHCQCGLSCVETSGSIGTGCECLSCQEGDGAKVGTKAQLLGSANLNQGTHPHTGPVVVGRRPHTGWNLPSISPVFCRCGRRCKKGRILGLWNYWCFVYECRPCLADLIH